MIQKKNWINLYWTPQNQAPTTAFCFCFHYQSSILFSVFHSVGLSAYSILIDSVFHSRWLLYFLFLLTHTHSFHQFYIKLLKATILHLQLHVNQPFSLSAWPLVCYRSIHTPLFTRVQLQSTQLLPQSFWLHWVYHFSIVQTLLYLLWLLLFSLFVCLYCYLSTFIMLMLNVCCSTGL